MASWDDEDFELTLVKNVPTVVTNKWEGEDEEENVKVSWEHEDEEQEQPKKLQQPQANKGKKKKLFEKIAGKERKREEEERRLLKVEQEEEISKLEQIRRQEDSDLKLFLETTFSGEQNNTTNVELPLTKAEFDEFTHSHYEKQKLEESEKTKKSESNSEAKLEVDHNNLHDFANDNDYDDFM